MLNKDLKNDISEIKKLTVDIVVLKNKLKKDKYCLAGSENELIQVRNCKQQCWGQIALSQQPTYYGQQVQNESFLSANKYSYLSNVTSTKLKETKIKIESQEHDRETSKWLSWVTPYWNLLERHVRGRIVMFVVSWELG